MVRPKDGRKNMAGFSIQTIIKANGAAAPKLSIKDLTSSGLWNGIYR